MGREISLREDSRGGERRDELVGTGDVFTERYRFVLLVHGFNRSRKKSKKLFTSFRENIRAFSNNLAEDMYEVYWPGDAYLPVIRTVMYPYKINEAKECGVLLADYLAKRKAPRNSKINIILIGHSLGCRLLLEALRDLSGKNLNKVTIHLVLMAAAVPKRFVESGGGLYAGTKLATSSYVMYSAADSVLKYLFTTGQKLAGEPGDPVGLKGEPKKMWNLSLSMDNYGHGEYWGSKDVAQTIAHWLGAPAPSIIFSRQPTTRPPAISRELGSYREISAILKLNHWRSQ